MIYLLALLGVIGCMLLVALVVNPALVYWKIRRNPYPLVFTCLRESGITAFFTRSSAANIPVNMQLCQRLGLHKDTYSVSIPLGATINMDGTAIYQGVLALFIAQAFGIDLSAGQYAMIILTATLASIGTAGIPGAGLIMLGLVLTAAGLPLEGVALIAGIDRILDMARTTVNVAGDLMTTTLVGRSEQELDRAIYDSSNKE